MATQQDILDFLNTLDPIPQDLINQLNKNPQATITRWMTCTEAQWEKIAGIPNGIYIYNYLHPPAKQAELTTPSLREIDINTLCAPRDVKCPVISDDSPPFTAKPSWLDDTLSSIITYFAKSDTDMERVPPMALVRCSRGGKTRALKEIAKALKEKMPDACIVYVSLNDYSSLANWEQLDPIGALCRRIAFAASGNPTEVFKEFRNTKLTADQISQWLNGCSCVLLVDELNLLTSLEYQESKSGREFATFVKENFLSNINRYFIFSSHVVSTLPALSTYMESVSNRAILAPELPLIPSLSIASQNLQWADLNPRQALYYGSIPALIYMAHIAREPYEKRLEAINNCERRGMVSNSATVRLLATFITGKHEYVPTPLLPLMDTMRERSSFVVRWIPYHMMEVLSIFAELLDQNLKSLIHVIVDLFNNFKNAKDYSGEGWEALFVISLLIRSITKEFDTALFPPLGRQLNVNVSYNNPFKGEVTFGEIKKVDDFIKSLSEPERFPHIAIYWPTHAQFEHYDVIVAVYTGNSNRQLYGYQLKEGKNLGNAEVSPLFTKSFVIRGDSTMKSSTIRGWYVANTKEISEFFGESGRNWTPMRWKELLL
jgi:hypothetical protein